MYIGHVFAFMIFVYSKPEIIKASLVYFALSEAILVPCFSTPQKYNC